MTEQHQLAHLADGPRGDEFAAVMDALEARHGSLRACQMLDSATATITREKNLAQAQNDLASALDHATSHLRQARAALQRLTDGDAFHTEYAEGTTGRDMDAFLADAERHIRATIALDQPLQASSA